jgi:LAO/AO transport system kinase
MLDTGNWPPGWTPPIVKTVATRGQGIAELADAIEAHLEYLRGSGEFEERIREAASRSLREAVRQHFVEELFAGHTPAFEEMVSAIVDRRLDPRSAARRLVQRFHQIPRTSGDISEDAE